ncbi:MAG: cyclic nucleotide-binding domain-containing protein [Azospirillum sp.]|nr:cyclic nucleotide-binding domain-containing protein [Azospirillum sp.]
MTGDAVAIDAEDGHRPGALAVCTLLKDMSPQAVWSLEDQCQWIRLPAGSVIFRHSDPPDAVYFIIEGTVRIFFRASHDREINYAQFGPGHMFGELAALDGLERSADVISITDTVLASCSREVFLKALRDYPEMAMALIMRFAAIIRQADQKIFSFSTLSGVQRVYLELIRLATPDNSGDGNWEISPAPLHKDIAGWAGTTTDVVGRAFGTLMRANLMRRRGNSLQILDRKRIELLSQTSSEDPA